MFTKPSLSKIAQSWPERAVPSASIRETSFASLLTIFQNFLGLVVGIDGSVSLKSFGLAHYLHVGISGTVIRSSDECRLAAQNNLFFLLESLLRKSIYHADFGFPDTVLV